MIFLHWKYFRRVSKKKKTLGEYPMAFNPESNGYLQNMRIMLA
jgi:hypothetical protein